MAPFLAKSVDFSGFDLWGVWFFRPAHRFALSVCLYFKKAGEELNVRHSEGHDCGVGCREAGCNEVLEIVLGYVLIDDIEAHFISNFFLENV
jgi:hypothetical protein